MRQISAMKLGGVLLLALMMAGCGGDDEKSAASTPQGSGAAEGKSNSAPTIEGQPSASILAGQSYTFRPEVADADGDELTFTATNLPAWAEFDASTGQLSGTPTSADIASYGGITIRVSDGISTVAMRPFTIAVTDQGEGSATLSWAAPTENSDGSALTNLAGYEVLYGRSADQLDQSVSLDNPSINTYVVENLTSGTWYFAVVAVNGDGATSSPSNVASKTI